MIGDKKQCRGDIEGDGRHPDGVEERLKKVSENNADHTGGDGGDDDQSHIFLERMSDQLPDILAVADDDRDQSGKVQEKLKSQPRFLRVHKITDDGKMTGTGDRQKFRQPLNNSEKDTFKPTHAAVPPSRL